MANLVSRLLNRNPEPSRHSISTIDDYILFNGNSYPLSGLHQTMSGTPAENIGTSLVDYVQSIHRRNGVVASAVTARALMMSQLRFRWRNVAEDSRKLTFGSQTLAPFERPAPDLTRPSWLYRLEMDASYAGNAYTRKHEDGTLQRLRPDWVDIVLGSNLDDGSDAVVLGYLYHPQGRKAGKRPVPLEREDVAHWAPEPDPLAHFRGESWVTGVLREIVGDGQATEHVRKFFENAATANMVVTAPEGVGRDEFERWIEMFDREHAGIQNAWRNIYLAHGSDATVVGSNLGDLAMKELQGGFETRIAARSRVPAVVLGIREGMQGSALNAGNYQQTRRLWADGWFTPYAEAFCASHERLLDRPNDGPVELTYDPSQIMFLQEDQQDAAEILAKQAQAIQTLHASGYEPDATVDAVLSNDLAKLKGNHTGMSSVQLQPPATSENNDESEQ